MNYSSHVTELSLSLSIFFVTCQLNIYFSPHLLAEKNTQAQSHMKNVDDMENS